MKTAISIPDRLFRAADALAKRTGRSRSRLYSDAVAEYVARHARDSIIERLDEVHARGAASDSFVQAASRRTLRESPW